MKLSMSPCDQAPELHRLLERVEADYHRRGWDQLPTLYTVASIGHGLPVQEFYRAAGNPLTAARTETHLAVVLAGPTSFAGGDVRERLLNIAMNTAYYGTREGDTNPAVLNAVTAIRGLLRLPGIAGFMFVHEGWLLGASVKEIKAFHKDGRSAADHPNGIEVRVAMFVGLDTSVHNCTRYRGRKRELSCLSPEHGRTHIGGTVPRALAVLCDLVTGALPDDPAKAFDASLSVEQVLERERAT